MAYSDYGAHVKLNGEYRYDKEDAEIYGGDPAWKKATDKSGDKWLETVHHGILGDGDIRVICHKVHLPDIYKLDGGRIKKIDIEKILGEQVDAFEYGDISFGYDGHEFRFISGEINNDHCSATMRTPGGDAWECVYGYDI